MAKTSSIAGTVTRCTLGVEGDAIMLGESDISLAIPCLPDLDLSANRRRSRVWQSQWHDTTIERNNAALILEDARRKASTEFQLVNLRTPIALHWTLYWPKGMRARDADGCADLLKPWIDAMKDLDWLPNDSPHYVPTISYTSVPRSPKGPSMLLRIERILACDTNLH